VDKIQKLQDLANSDNPVVSKMAKEQLERLATEGAVQVQVGSATGNIDAEVRAIIDALNSAISGGVSDPDEIRTIVLEELKKIKIDYDDLSDALKSMLNSSKKVEVVVRNIVGRSTTTSSTDAFLKRTSTCMAGQEPEKHTQRKKSPIYSGGNWLLLTAISLQVLLTLLVDKLLKAIRRAN
jgi:predicted DNA binding protein